MLKISDFEVSRCGDETELVYFGENQYIISEKENGFSVFVQELDENGDVVDGPDFDATSLSEAIAYIERMEG